jgi:hypothetical protein
VSHCYLEAVGENKVARRRHHSSQKAQGVTADFADLSQHHRAVSVGVRDTAAAGRCIHTCDAGSHSPDVVSGVHTTMDLSVDALMTTCGCVRPQAPPLPPPLLTGLTNRTCVHTSERRRSLSGCDTTRHNTNTTAHR